VGGIVATALGVEVETPGAQQPEATDADGSSLTAVAFADVNHDGQNELLVQHGAGAHSTMFKILGWRDYEFQQLDELHTSTPAGFSVGDLDGDGRVEVATFDVRVEGDLGYAGSPRDEVLYRWEGDRMREVDRREAHRPVENWSAPARWFTDRAWRRHRLSALAGRRLTMAERQQAGIRRGQSTS
jgi:hypothetical protein